MKTKLILKLGDGNFQRGFPNSTIEICSNGGNTKRWNCHLPSAPEIPQTYKEWQQGYHHLVKRKDPRRGFRNRETYQTQSPVVNCETSYQKLSTTINNWLNDLAIIQQLETFLNSQESTDNSTICLEVNTQQVTDSTIKYLLHQLPFETWDFLNSYRVMYYLRLHQTKSNFPETKTEVKSKSVKILCIVGDDQGIDLTTDKELIDNLRHQRGAKPVFLPDSNAKQLTRADFDKLWRSRWEILIFTGHSDTRLEGRTGTIYLNPNEFLDFQDIKETLEEAKRLGLKLAIFNSCDGLGLAEQLKHLGITVIVWREPVPNKIASLFLRYFLDEFTKDADTLIYEAIRKARKRMEEVGGLDLKELTGVTGLPVIIHNGSTEPPTWNQFRGRSGGITGHADWTRTYLPSQQESDRQIFIFLKQFEFEVKSFFNKSQSKQASELINLSKELQSKQVKPLLTGTVLISHDEARSPQEQLPPYTEISEVFYERVNRKLLILGAIGAGKTTTMFELARELVEQALRDTHQPIPAYFKLSTWAQDKQSVSDWLIDELGVRGVEKNIAKQWLTKKKILPMLDGLDELKEDLQEPCVKKINKWLKSKDCPSGLVVCSRIENYKKYESKLELNGAISLQPLSDQQIQNYLNQLDQDNLWKAIANNPSWLTLVRSPLWLSMTIVLKISDKKMQELTSKEKQLNYLLKEYVEYMLNRRFDSTIYMGKNLPKAEQIKHGLIHLAEQMEQQSETEYLIDNIQPDVLLRVWEKRMYFTSIFIITAILGGVGGLMGGLLLKEILLGWIWFVMAAPIVGLLCTIITMRIRYVINPSRTVKYTIKAFLYRLRLGMISTISLSIIGLLIFEISIRLFYGIKNYGVNDGLLEHLKVLIAYSLNEIFIDSLKYGLLYGVFFGVALVMINKLIITAPKTEKRKSSNEKIIDSFKDVATFGTSLTLVGLLVARLNNLPTYGIIASGVIAAIFGGLAGGGGASIQHFSLRLVLYFTGKVPFKNYSDFLNHAEERRLLMCIGGRYQFVHKYLQQYFAGLLPK